MRTNNLFNFRFSWSYASNTTGLIGNSKHTRKIPILAVQAISYFAALKGKCEIGHRLEAYSPTNCGRGSSDVRREAAHLRAHNGHAPHDIVWSWRVHWVDAIVQMLSNQLVERCHLLQCELHVQQSPTACSVAFGYFIKRIL